MSNKINFDKITMGVCYYPEHWDASLWRDDLKRMKDAGIEIVRVAEFAWALLEPAEGTFSFELFDAFMDVAVEEEMKVILGTPTATPPSWLTEKYPESLNADINGVLYRHGCRRHYNYNAPKYIELSSIIVEKMAAHYGSHPCVIGWQLDNELNCEISEFYSESDSIAFRKFLQNKYANLDALNKAWGTRFWSQTYTQWEQIYVPRKVVSNSNNPHLMLDYIRFISDSACNFAKMQSDIIKKYKKPQDFITTNGMFPNLDNHKMTEESLDFYTYDSYPNFAFCMDEDPNHSTDLNDRKWSRNLTEVRSISSTFGIMEQQSGPNGWNTRMEAPAPKPGQMTLWTMQSIAHGADFISYFRWRTCSFGTELYWHGILDYSNRDNRRLAEVKSISEKFGKIKEVAGAEGYARLAVIKDYDNIWDAQEDKWHQRIEKVSEKGIFQAAQLTHTPMDYLYLRENTTLSEMAKYKVLIYPHASIMTAERAALLTAYVEQGGKLVFGCRTAYKDLTGQAPMEKLPVHLRALSDTDIPEYTFVGPADEMSMVEWNGKKLPAAVFNDILAPLSDASEVLGRYTTDYYAGEPGLICNKVGAGEVYYFGGAFTRETATVFLENLDVATPFSNEIALPKDCELMVRKKADGLYLFVLNYSKKEVTIELKKAMGDLYSGQEVSGEVSLEGYGTRVYKLA